jgi:hypothetical protein
MKAERGGRHCPARASVVILTGKPFGLSGGFYMTFTERLQDIVSKGIATSKDIASRARDQAQTWGEMGVLRIEIVQLRSQAEKMIMKLGAEVYTEFVQMSQASIVSDAPAIKSILRNIHEIELAIDEKEEHYRKLGGKDADLDA